ncbi:MAG: hypothetical protein CMJ78_03100 [Planctomycetaceae bacterium]|nr:hypothetical protein [Planctomycetaceae bacterium]
MAKIDPETRYRLVNAEKQRYNLVIKIFKEQFDHSRRMATLKRFHGIEESARQHLMRIERKRLRAALAPTGASEVKVTMGVIVALLVVAFTIFNRAVLRTLVTPRCARTAGLHTQCLRSAKRV